MSTTPTPPPEPSPSAARHRPVRFVDLLAGLPALGAVAALVAALGAARSDQALATSYREEATRRVRAKDLDVALDCFKRLIVLTPDKPEYRFALVVLLDAKGRQVEAEAVARSLAPTDRPGHPLAHLYLARRLLADRTRGPSAVPLAEGHLLRTIQLQPKSRDAKALLGSLYAATGRPREARPLLEEVAGDNPELLLELARVCKQAGDDEGFRRRLEAATNAARVRVEARADDKVARLLWAQALTMNDDYAGALEVLGRGNSLSGDESLRESMATVCASWSLSLEKNPRSRPSERLEVLERGLIYSPENPELLRQLGRLMGASGEDAEKARALVQTAVASGKATALGHFLLGNDAFNRGKDDEARTHWEQAHNVDEKMPLITNNLAWALAYREPADPERALGLIDRALVLTPKDPRLHGTRGQILVKLDRYKDAVTELEFALTLGENTPGIHEALAKAYDGLKMPDLAAEHRKPH